MPYLGNTPSTSFATIVKDTFNGGSTGYTLSKVATTNSVSVFVENVRQEPTTAYAVSGTTLTFTATTPSGTGNIYVLHMNPTTTTTHPASQNLTAVDGTFTGAFTSLGIDDNADANAIIINSNESVGIGSAVTTSDLNIGKGINSNYTGIQFTSPNNSTGTQLIFGDQADDDYSSLTAFASSAGETGRMRFIAGTKESLNIFNTGNVALTDGNLVMASGHGIDFSATGDGAATDTSELLDDYEEGTWTPTILGSSSHPSITTSVAAGKYIKVGNLVFIQWNMIITNVASQGVGNAQVGGLPYAAVCNTYQGHIGIMYNDVWDSEVQKAYVPNGGAYMQLAPTGRTQSNFGFGTLGTGYFGGGGSYIVG